MSTSKKKNPENETLPKQNKSSGYDFYKISNAIYFSDDANPYYEFSTIYPGYKFSVNGIQFPTANHYYHWQKFNDNITKYRILSAPTGKMAGYVADDAKHLIIPSFNKETAMANALKEKFTQNDQLKKLLLSTKPFQLIQHTSDKYWSDGGDGSGKNILGKLLMELRDNLG